MVSSPVSPPKGMKQREHPRCVAGDSEASPPLSCTAEFVFTVSNVPVKSGAVGADGEQVRAEGITLLHRYRINDRPEAQATVLRADDARG